MSKIYKGTLGLIGNTPLVEVVNIEKELGLEATLLVKLEYLNPAGSVKDRIAKAMVEDAEEKGILKEGSVIIEPTSGKYDLCTVSFLDVSSFHTHRLRHRKNDSVSFCCCNRCKTDSCITGCWFNDHRTFF